MELDDRKYSMSCKNHHMKVLEKIPKEKTFNNLPRIGGKCFARSEIETGLQTPIGMPLS